MIVPMKKVSLVILEKEREEALEKLRTLGVLHIENLQGNSEKLARYKEISANTLSAYSILSEIKRSKKAKKIRIPSLGREETVQKCAHVIQLSDEKKALFEQIAADAAELDRFSSWGDVDPADFAFLSEKGIHFALYEIPEDKYNHLDDSVKTILVNSGKKQVRFLAFTNGQGRPDGLPPEAFEVPLPEISTTELAERITLNEKKIQEIDTEIKNSAVYIPDILELKNALSKDIEFENVYSGMGKETNEKETSLAWISGYVPIDSFDKLSEAAKINGWALASADPTADDSVPTKLKNNKIVSLIYPLTDFLGTVPGYNEFDISGWFLLFFTIFFGMIFGDAGYGLLLLFADIVLLIKGKVQKKPFNPGYGLLFLLSLATVVWGTVTCTWFGLDMSVIPQWLKDVSVPALSNAFTSQFDGKQSLLTTDQNMQIFCFALALIQLSIAHITCIRAHIKTLKCIGDFGSLFMLWGMFYVVLAMVVSSSIFGFDKVIYGIPVGTVSIALVGGGFILSFVFSNYDGNIGKSILESCKNIISVILGVVNVFSDIVSYIRLWAVGLAGAAISGTVNTMAGPMIGHASLFAAFVILLVFGHGLNIILNVLSVIVHGVRLNTLEFSSHLGMAWSGFKYEPFSETVKK